MRGRPLVVNWQHDAEQLKLLFTSERQPHRRSRLQALYLLRKGKTIGDAAEAVGMSYDTVQRWLNHYRQGGLAALDRHLPTNKPGPQSYLTADQQADLRLASRRGEFRTAADVQAYIKRQFGVAYKKGSCYSVLRRLRLKPKVPRPRAVKADDQAQAAWKKGG